MGPKPLRPGVCLHVGLLIAATKSLVLMVGKPVRAPGVWLLPACVLEDESYRSCDALRELAGTKWETHKHTHTHTIYLHQSITRVSLDPLRTLPN